MHPTPSTPEHPTMAALGLEKPLPPGTTAAQQATAREVQDAAALTWLAVAQLQPAPQSIWQGILSEITPPTAAPVRRPWQLPITCGGWAAAAALALAWWGQSRPPAPRPASSPFHEQATRPNPIHNRGNPSAAPPRPAGPEDSRLREELLELRQRLAAATQQPEIPGVQRPAIIELHTPGQGGGHVSTPAAAARIQQLVTRALQRDLILRDDANNGSDIVLERGWPSSQWLAPDGGQTIRHLSFPADRWEELGLWKSPALFYDPATSLTWTPAPDGLGYLGSVSPNPPDPAAFTKPRPKAELQPLLAESSPPSQPSGYLVSEPGSPDATLLLTGLPPVPDGGQQYVLASNADGISQRYQIAGAGLSIPNAVGNLSLAGSSSTEPLTLSSLSMSGQFTNFQVLQIIPGHSTPTLILTNSAP